MACSHMTTSGLSNRIQQQAPPKTHSCTPGPHPRHTCVQSRKAGYGKPLGWQGFQLLPHLLHDVAYGVTEAGTDTGTINPAGVARNIEV
jgi:hypothetical protein